ncbi:hypothetical protein UFOVP1058_48 [uncultured Caudovirales phage]|uniref:Uncharacterized protein n=1 Tax=uncultured Caudovirales phage TaxID=2100421 RepID=A0A6J5T1R8_9CAUD|nr:hypothetical protein UFOVP656_32 [uncultured Caudovirales phage]CAB4167823.1 hypothetical protein UFOVP857_54 [uncultured Caudovirales phage]CAB4168504.1 hypothetical protein UFOVP879_61 [uncultured Caudovirales phage]CAB4181585.1 hypothetical protein UFOVP1058_48 [uncultured Caudovirales phage]CAB4195220.1 hypothetical protein UFOVP1289_3 [uncultured Caudovirales phage]
MQYDVKSKHMSASGVAVSYRTRLKSIIVSANTTAAARNTVFADNVPQLGTYSITSTTMTVTVANTLVAGDRVWLDFTSGTGVDNAYTVLTADASSFTVTTAASGTGDVTMYSSILMEADSYNATAYSVLIPGEGILAHNGIYVGLVTNVTATVFYG